MIEGYKIVREAADRGEVGGIIRRFVDLDYSKSREQIAEDFWRSLTVEELDFVANEDSASLMAYVGLKSIFENADPSELSAVVDHDLLPLELLNVITVASLERSIRSGLIHWNGKYFYNPFEESEAEFNKLQ